MKPWKEKLGVRIKFSPVSVILVSWLLFLHPFIFPLPDGKTSIPDGQSWLEPTLSRPFLATSMAAHLTISDKLDQNLQ